MFNLKYLILGGIALSILGGAFWYIKDSENKKIRLEILNQEVETERNTRDGANSTSDDPDVVLDQLRERNSD